MLLPALNKGPAKTNRNRSARHRAKLAAKNNRRRQGLKK
jgi:hypothetical protein